jgi:hypothetical protein
MARSERVVVYLEPETLRQVTVLADGVGISVSSFINMLLLNAVSMVSSTFETMGASMEGLQAADREHDGES